MSGQSARSAQAFDLPTLPSNRTDGMMMAQLEYATGRNYITAAPAGKAAYEGYQGHGVLTYAILEALHRQQGAAADPVSVFDIAAHISRQVPAISQRTFGIRQQPRFSPTGEDFPLGVRAAVLRPAIETKPAAVLRALSVRAGPAEDAAITETLARGARVRIKRVEGAWSLIERNDKEIGYVLSDGLLELERN